MIENEGLLNNPCENDRKLEITNKSKKDLESAMTGGNWDLSGLYMGHWGMTHKVEDPIC